MSDTTPRGLDLTDPNSHPERTPEMIEKGQVWAWMYNTPHKPPTFFDGTELAVYTPEDSAGRWEIRGTGVRF